MVCVTAASCSPFIAEVRIDRVGRRRCGDHVDDGRLQLRRQLRYHEPSIGSHVGAKDQRTTGITDERHA